MPPDLLALSLDENGMPLNPDLEAAYEAFAGAASPESARAFYAALRDAMLIVPEQGALDERPAPTEKRVSRAGEKIRVDLVIGPAGIGFPIFSSAKRLLACYPSGARVTAMTMPAIAKMIVGSGRAVKLVYNPTPDGGFEVPADAVAALARRELP